MRTAIVVAVVMMAGGAGAQDQRTIASAISSVATATASASPCGFVLNRDRVAEVLAAGGFNRDNPTHASDLERSFSSNSAAWNMSRLNGVVSAEGKAAFESQCSQTWDAYGPDGTIRKGLVSRK